MKVCVTYWGKDNKVNQTTSFDFKYCVSFFSMTAFHNYTMCKITRIKKIPMLIRRVRPRININSSA